MASIKDRNRMDLPELEDIKKKRQEKTKELYKKDLNDPDDNHKGSPRILKWVAYPFFKGSFRPRN